MYNLNAKIRNLEPYEALSGDYRIRLDANESFLTLPESINNEIMHELSKVNLNRYPDSSAREVCEAFADFYGLNVNNVVAGNGSDELISIIISAFLEKGDSYATLEPDFSMYSFYGKISEAENAVIEKNADFEIEVDNAIEVCKNKNIKLLIFSNPCNPTSIGLSSGEVKRIIGSLPEALIVVDEAYMDFWSESMLSEVNAYDNLLILKTCSKAFGMAGIRLGFAVSSEKIINAIKAVKSPYNLNSPTQIIGKAVLSNRKAVNEAFQRIISSREKLSVELSKLDCQGRWKILESKTNFISIIMKDARSFFEFMESLKIAIRYTCGIIRVTCGTEEENSEFIRAAKEFWRER